MSKTQLLAAIDNDRAELVDFLHQLVRGPSPNPPGDTRAAADVVWSFLAGRNIEATVLASRAEMPNVVSEFEGDAPGERLILNGHLDVFPVGDANGWDRDP
jgi:succinyl-diaminopimelate desuccinylase